jgi:hypothetical protein
MIMSRDKSLVTLSDKFVGAINFRSVAYKLAPRDISVGLE